MNKILVSLLLTLGITGIAHAAGNAEAGQEKVAVCGACHGADGNSAAPNFPKIAGQGPNYLFKQLQDIKVGSSPTAEPGVGRKVLEMTGILDPYSDQDLQDIAAYFASQEMTIGMADPALVAQGEQLFRGGKLEEGMPACTGCHAPNGVGVNLARFPRLGGQHAAYTAKQLTDFREGERTNDGDTAIMRTIASKLSNKEIQALASYIQGLH